MTRIGIVGTGIISDLLLGGLKLAKIPLEAACDVDEARARAAAAPFGARVFTDYAKMLADPAIDAVIVALPNHMHFDACMQALAAGKHVFCEKPMTTRVQDSVKLVEAVRQSGKVFQVGYMKRYNPAYAAMKARLEAIGPVLGASFLLTSSGKPLLDGPSVKPTDWHADPAKVGGLFLVHSGSHLLDLMMHLFGLPEKAWGEVKRDRNGNEYHSNIFFKMRAGGFIHFCLTTVEAQGYSYGGTGWDEVVAVTGMKGRFQASIADWRGVINPVAVVSEPDGLGPKRLITLGSQWAEEFKAFVDGIAQGRCLGSSAEEGYRVDVILDELKKLERSENIGPFAFAD